MGLVSVIQTGRECRVQLNGALDMNGVEELFDVAADIAGNRSVVIDLQELEFIDSTGIGGLLQFVRVLQEGGSSLRFVQIREEIRDIFEVLGVDEIIGGM